jgi:hypothetical protein
MAGTTTVFQGQDKFQILFPGGMLRHSSCRSPSSRIQDGEWVQQRLQLHTGQSIHQDQVHVAASNLPKYSEVPQCQACTQLYSTMYKT